LKTSAAVAAGPDLTYLFTLLSLVLPREPVRLASESLHSGDPQMRGLALEYLETAVPPDVSTLLLEAVGQPSNTSEIRVGEST
jgi:hypothetical protein